ncbi:sterol O-acyltransferase 1 isoform X5 [Siniperca chuatsi]|uniref:sterol O-acyltransferase 1 isoform X5 n=1 Tax=Siniperca chuatsi TaxID=119488 RepID=UPI001CE1E057|nr:sterol O-acyltransferase 1 isoform X5 [Siniperca chuatsi]
MLPSASSREYHQIDPGLMESGEDSVLRSRCRVIPKLPTFPDLDSSLDGGCNQGEHQQGSGSNHITSNGTFEVEHVISKKLQLKRKAEQCRKMKSNVTHLKSDLMRQFDSQVNDFMDSLIEESASLEPAPVPAVFSPLLSDKEKSKLRHFRPPHGLGKQFVSRRSLLDELFEVNHIRTIYHMFIALLILFILSTLVVDFIDEGRLVLDFDLLVYAFGQFPLVVCTWICMFLSVLLVPYTLFHLWSQTQSGSYSHPRLYSLLFGSVFLLYQALGLGFLPTYVVVTNSFPPASCFIIILEQVRLMMKGHSFVRENVPRVLTWANDKTSPSPVVPQVSQYLYFLFAPTLIYRDKYPRNPVIRWGYVATKLLQECWFSFWHSLHSSTVGLMLLLRCSALLTGCFTRIGGIQPLLPITIAPGMWWSMTGYTTMCTGTCSGCLRSVSDQQPCCLCLQCLQWSTSTFLQSALASSIPCSSASLCALE